MSVDGGLTLILLPVLTPCCVGRRQSGVPPPRFSWHSTVPMFRLPDSHADSSCELIALHARLARVWRRSVRALQGGAHGMFCVLRQINRTLRLFDCVGLRL